ncbi:ATP synthase subunit E [Jackrogersella minutella]|nr:ATP synthase subunit E [Jackrogersella minutella]
MSTTSGVNVLRYTALSLGVFYGFTHQRSLTKAQKATAARREYEHKQQLIQRAKAEYARTKNPAPQSSEKSGLNQDPMDPNFDLEAYFNALVSQKP